MRSILFILTILFSLSALALNDENQMIYEDLTENGLDKTLVASALLWRENNSSLIPQNDFIVLVDMKLHSSKKRFFKYHVPTRTFDEYYVAHGVNSDKDNDGVPEVFSNTEGSWQSSLGAYVTAETYYSYKFKSRALKLDGFSKGLNTNVRSRYIVLHEAPYAEEEIIEILGRLGVSQGCLVLDPAYAQEVIDDIDYGTFIFVGYGDEVNRYLTKSQRNAWLNEIQELIQS